MDCFYLNCYPMKSPLTLKEVSVDVNIILATSYNEYCVCLGQALERLKGAIDAAVLKASLESSCTPQKERTPEDNWSKRIDKIEEQCTLNREKYAKARISALAPNSAICEMCHSELSAIVTCSTCQKNMCSRCDQAVHCGQPFHRRRVYSSKENHVSLLKPTSFVDEYGQLFEMSKPKKITQLDN